MASDLGLHCLPVTLLGISRLQCDNALNYYMVRQKKYRQSSVYLPIILSLLHRILHLASYNVLKKVLGLGCCDQSTPGSCGLG